ncbi:MAG: hypothetical protein PHY02_03480 [Phycisphaerae bacterium]|nr:hypothetical protein [Phycisphaerae bacterium]
MTEVAMQRKYFTRKAGVFFQSVRSGKELWIKQDRSGKIQRLAGGLLLPRGKFEELIEEYPSSLLDKTNCLDAEVARELFEDARREKFAGNIEYEDTVIFFLIEKGPDKYEIGCSSTIERIEEIK